MRTYLISIKRRNQSVYQEEVFSGALIGEPHVTGARSHERPGQDTHGQRDHTCVLISTSAKVFYELYSCIWSRTPKGAIVEQEQRVLS